MLLHYVGQSCDRVRLVDDRVRAGVERAVGRRRNGRSPFEESDGSGGAGSGARATHLMRSQN
jgi:hypothetical protein